LVAVTQKPIKNAELRSLAELRLPEAEGGEIDLGDLWADRPLAIAWLRHYA
jgi:hypothetical protein